MLRTMRNKFKHLSWTLWLVIIAFIVGFSMTGIFSKNDSTSTDLLNVGDEAIPGEKFEQQLYMTLENYNAQFQNKLNQQTINQLRIPEQVLQNIVSSEIIFQEALKLNLSVSDEELGQNILTNPAFQQNGKFIGQENYKNMLQYRRINVADFENGLKRDLLLDKLKQIVTAGVTIDEALLKEQYKQQSDQVELDYIALTPTTIKEEIILSAEEINSYYNTNKEKYKSPEMRSGRFLVLPFEALKSEIKLDDNELNQYYRDHKEEFKTPAKRRISRILLPYDDTNRSAMLKDAQKLADALTFEGFPEQAKAVSKDGKAASGGDWGETEWQSFSKQEVSIAEKLIAKQISTPVDTGSGFSIMTATLVTTDQYQSFNEVKPRIQSMVERDKLHTLALDMVNKLGGTLKEKENITTAKSEGRFQKIESQPLAMGDSLPGTDEVGYLSRRLFSMKADEIAFPAEFPTGIAIVQLVSIQKPAVQAMGLVTEQIKADLSQVKKAALLVSRAKMIVDELNQAKGDPQVEEILKKNELKKETTVYRRGDKFAQYPMKKGLDGTVFSLPLEQYASPLNLEQAVIIPRAKKIVISSEAEYQTARQAFYLEQLGRRRDDYFASYILGKRDLYPVKFNEKLFTEIRANVLARFK